MAKKKLQQFYILKFNSNRLKDYKYDIKVTLEEARKNNEVVSVGESQVIRSLLKIVGRSFERDKLEGLEIRKKILTKRKNSEKNKSLIIETINEISSILFVPEIINIEFSNKSHYRKISKDGLFVNGKEYVRLLAGAGNVRRNTAVFIQKEFKAPLTEILENGREMISIVPAKYNAYFALYNSSTLPVSFPKFTVVKDCFITSTRKMDYIPSDKDDFVEEGKAIDLELNSFDGQGLISPKLAKQWADELGLDYIPASFIIRAPFIKGMVVVFDFHKFVEENVSKIKSPFFENIYGDLVGYLDVDLILTESQFKMFSAYPNLSTFVENCQYNELGFGVSRVSPKYDRSYVRSNYQFLQVLDLDDDEIIELCNPTVSWFEDLVGEDPEKMLIYLLGSLTNEDIDRDIFYSLDYITQALILDRYTANDPYIRSRFLNSINRKVYDSFLGKLILEGNYQFLIADPYAMAEHIFGLPVRGLLYDGEHYSQFWNNRGVDTVASCRPPLTYTSETNILNLKTNSVLNKWFKYLNSGIVIPAGGIGVDVVLFADADHDGDIVFTTSNRTFINGKIQGLPISYDKSVASKKVVDNFDPSLPNVDMDSFNSKIGFITNVSSSLYVLQQKFEEGSREWVEIDKRLKLCRKFQGDAIDAGKGIKIKPFPEKFINYQSVPDDASKEEREKIEFENSIVVDGRPYFFRYLYSDYSRRFKRHFDKFDLFCQIKFGISLDELLSKDNKTEEEQKTYDNYYRYNFFMHYPSTMNKICWNMETSIPEIRSSARQGDINYLIYMDRGFYHINDDDLSKMISLYNQYKKQKKNLFQIDDFDNLDHFVQYIRERAFKEIGNDIRYLASIAVVVCYAEHPSQSNEFAWKCFGDGIIQNIINNKFTKGLFGEKSIFLPVKDNRGTISYLWDNYKLKERDLNEIK